MDSGKLVPSDLGRGELQTTDLGRQYRLQPDFQYQSQNAIREYWSILLKRKMVVITPVLILVTLAAISSVRATPLYDAFGRVSIHREGGGFSAFKEGSLDISQEDYDPTIALETQTRVLESDSLALQVVNKLHLDKNPVFAGPSAATKKPPVLEGPARFSPEEEASFIGGIKGSLSVKNIPNTRLLEIHYRSPDPRLAAEVVNTLISEYIELNIKTKYDSAMQASEWLTNQLADLQIKVESSQQKLVKYQQENGILGGDEKSNIIVAKLEDLNKQLTDAEADRIRKDSVYRQKMLRQAFDGQKQQANLLNQRAIQYNLLKREADSNRQLYEGLLQRLKEAGMAAGLKSSNVQIVDAARIPTAPFSTNIPRNIELALMLGLTCRAAVAFALEALDQTVHTVEQAEIMSSLPSLGMVPLFREGLSINRYFALAAKNNSNSRNQVVALSHPKSE